MDSILKDKVQRTAWNKVFDSGSAMNLKIFHPDYEHTAKEILQRAQNHLGYKTLNDLLVPDKVKRRL